MVNLLAFLGLLALPLQLKAQEAPTLPMAQIAEAVCGKDLVVLGELPSHGEAHTFQAKAQIVEYLVQECGFNAVFFEAPIYDFLGFQEAVAENRAEPIQLDRAIGGFWLTRELRAWRAWLFTQATEEKLFIGGLDDQISATSHYARATLPPLVASVLPPENAAECQQAIARNLYWRYDAEHPFNEAEQIRLQQCARRTILAIYSQEDADPAKSLMARNLANLYGRQRNAIEAHNRDEMMYTNFHGQRARLPENSKCIIWTATVHAARQQGDLRDNPLGAGLAAQWGDRMATLGFTTFTGESSMAGTPIKTMPEAPEGSLEAQVTAAHTNWVYLNPSALQEMGAVPARLLGRFTTADWSLYFDGVLVIREEVAPTFEPK